ncbi:hypothetical protein AAF712_008128 [Marasmius tenuissimus]|uniref:Prolyl 4-hydroxylase alpha subunit Fe(2+) 2OG dioxygenase domain-containing protein n=1 Tax=Marasmius tenuissimus TaxID=585030 RepID=A0ABR2ZT81_9AGAR
MEVPSADPAHAAQLTQPTDTAKLQQSDFDAIPPSASTDEPSARLEESMAVDDVSSENSEEESETEDLDEDGFPMIEDPSENILEDFEEALSGDLDFQGTFAFSKTYDDAPNPALCLEGLGTVGLPLSERDAKLVIENSIQAPFGKGERTVVDTEVRDTWEIDGSKVHFQEARWKSFMDRVVQEVCQGLGVNVQASQPRHELYKLLIYETGSHFLPHVDTEKTNGMFASIIVVLPSRFTGGDAHVSHGKLKNVFNSSNPSLTKTTVLSWYTDVMHEIKPITSGYRLALSYNLFHTTNSIRPSLSSIADGIGPLRHVLLSWKQQESSPDKIIYMLDYKYSRASLSASALKGQDAHIVAALDSLSKELGFSLGLAHIEHRQTGSATNEGGGSYYYGRRGRYGCAYDEYDDDEDDDVEMEEIHDRSTSIENLVDLDGKLISRNVTFDDETETIPANFDEYFEDEGWDDQQYEGYQGNYGGDVNRFYRRSALVIWPGWTRLGNEEGNRRTVYALQRLRTLDGPEPTNEEMDLFNYVCRSTAYRRDSRTLQTLCQVARQWKRVDLWLNIASTIRGGQLATMLPVEEVAGAVTQFGHSKISKELRDIVLSDQSVMSRLKYLAGLEEWAKIQGGDPSQNLLLLFVNDMRIFTFDNLPLVDTSQLSFLTDEAMKHGGVQRLKKRPLRKEPVKIDVIQSYATYLHKEMKRLAPNAADQSLLREMITEMLTSLLKLLDLFQVKTVTSPAYYSYHQAAKGAATLKGDPAIAMKFIAQSLESGNVPIAIAALKRMTDMTGQTQDIARARAITVLLPLIQLLSKDPRTKPFLPQLQVPLAGISEVAIPLVLQSIEAKGGAFTQDTICTLLDSLVICGKPQVLTSVILPKIHRLKWDETSWKLCMEQLYSRRKAFTTIPGAESLVKTAVGEMAKLYAQKVSLPAAQQTSGYSYYGTRNTQATSILAILDTCDKLGGLSALAVVLKRILAPKMTAEYLRNALVPLLPGLCQLAQREGKAVSSEPFASTIRTIMNNWVKVILGTKPSEAAAQPLLAKLQKFTCQQHNCVQVRKFLTTPNAEHSMKLDRIGAPARKHVEKELQTHAYGAATFELIRTTPQGLTIKKHDALFQPARWRAIQQEGVKLLKEIGQEGVIKAIWGDGYTTFIHKMNGIPTSTQTANQNINPRLNHPVATGTSTAVAGPSRTQLPPPRPAVPVGGVVPGVLVAQGANTQLGQQSTTRAGIATAATMGCAAPVTPAKRKFDAVIDLTSDGSP